MGLIIIPVHRLQPYVICDLILARSATILAFSCSIMHIILLSFSFASPFKVFYSQNRICFSLSARSCANLSKLARSFSICYFAIVNWISGLFTRFSRLFSRFFILDVLRALAFDLVRASYLARGFSSNYYSFAKLRSRSIYFCWASLIA